MASIDLGRGHVRLEAKDKDTAILKESITLPFSKRVAFNRMMKAPMTERLCFWNKDGEDIVSIAIRYSQLPRHGDA